MLVIVLIWQGPKNLPKLGSALGRSISDFRKEVSTDEKPDSTTTPAARSLSCCPASKAAGRASRIGSGRAGCTS